MQVWHYLHSIMYKFIIDIVLTFSPYAADKNIRLFKHKCHSVQRT